MSFFKVTISISLYNPTKKSNSALKLDGEFEANNEQLAVKDAKEWYAMEFGTTEEEIQILKVKELNK